MIDNFDHLLLQCKKRRFKKIARLLTWIILPLLLISAAVGGYWQWSKSAVVQPPRKTQTPKPLPIVETNISEGNESVKTAATASIPVTTPTSVIDAPKPLKPAITPLTAAPKEVIAAPTPPTPAPKSNRLLEVSTASSAPMNAMETYHKDPKYDTALAVARDFYAKGTYADAAIWAKKANQLNREEEEAWLLYAKAYYAQGRKKEAIGVLELYLNYKESKAASELLRSWR